MYTLGFEICMALIYSWYQFLKIILHKFIGTNLFLISYYASIGMR
jgi:hypothetical protein